MRTIVSKHIRDVSNFKKQLLHWANTFQEFVFLDSNNYNQKYSSFDALVAVEAFTSIKTDYKNAFEDLHQYQSHTKDWLFGYLSYDLKNDIENLNSSNFDGLEFDDLYFFQPKKIFLIKGNQLEMHYLRLCDDEIESAFKTITSCLLPFFKTSTIEIKQRISKKDYLSKVSKILDHIHRGDLYEANFCMEFFAENTPINPLEIYHKLNSISEAPFAVSFKNNFQFLISASPDRYLRKQESKIITQPIKGTARRSHIEQEDKLLIADLASNEKERSENIMIVDLVRNDLSKKAMKGSVFVEELCEVYTFKQVHQMISTVVSEVENTTSPTQILKSTFPMGSMTGAPKISAMKIIEELEESKRGLYSGAMGYFMPTGDFDFNVIIRSILFNSNNNYLSFSVGSAITAMANPQNEYEECLLKAKAMFDVLHVNNMEIDSRN